MPQIRRIFGAVTSLPCHVFADVVVLHAFEHEYSQRMASVIICPSTVLQPRLAWFSFQQ